MTVCIIEYNKHFILKLFYGIRACWITPSILTYFPWHPLPTPPLPTPHPLSKLEGPNYLSWVHQSLLFLKSHDLLGIVDGTEPCPAKFPIDDTGKPTTMVNPQYSVWQKKDQYLLSWFNTTMSESMLSSVYGLNTARQVWTSLSTHFASQSKSRVAYLKRQLQSLNQGTHSYSEFLSQAKS
jgi:hypothetical protein